MYFFTNKFAVFLKHLLSIYQTVFNSLKNNGMESNKASYIPTLKYAVYVKIKLKT